MWKKISSEEIFQHPRLTLIEDTVLLPNTTQTKYLTYKFQGEGIAVIVAEAADGKILLQKEYSYPCDSFLWQFPGGMVAPGEPSENGAFREFREETGYAAEKLSLLGKYYADNRRSVLQAHVYYATGITSAHQELDPEEDIEPHWFAPSEIDALIARGEIVQKDTLAAWCLFKVKA